MSDVPALDLLTGSDAARQVIEDNVSLEPLLHEWCHEVEVFERELDGVLLYRGEA